MRTVLPVLCLSGCLWVDAGAVDDRLSTDQDQDGVAVDVDCDDQDATVGGPAVWYGDADGDGWGSPTQSETACQPSEGFVADGGDCDDTTAAVNPGAQELWYDGVDGDCAGDDDYDADQDGDRSADWGGDDCDDQESAVHSSAVEVCDDGLDNDCDQTANSCGWAGEVDLALEPRIRGEAAQDRLGLVIEAMGDLDDDGHGDFAVSAYRASVSEGVTAGIVGLVFEPVETTQGLTDAAGARYLGVSADDRTGRSMALVGYLTGDGQPDLAIGAERYALGGVRAGGVHLAPVVTQGDVDLETEAVAVVGDDWDLLGRSVVSPGDADGDGYADLWIGAPGHGDTQDIGAAWLVHGPITQDTPVHEADAWKLVGDDVDDMLGWRVQAGDVTGDGVIDLIAGSPGSAGGAGAVFVVEGPRSADLATADAVRISGEPGDDLGLTLDLADLDGDGQLDLLACAPGANHGGTATGVVAVVPGPIESASSISEATTRLGGVDAQARVGGSVSAGDLDADGTTDLLIGADGWDDNRGRAFLVLGPFAGSVDVTQGEARFPGVAELDRLGGDVEVLGDLDGDPYPELGLGAWGADGEAGSMYVLLGGAGL